MRNRGISSVVLPVVVISIILVAASYSILTQKSGEELPVYPGAAPSEIPESELFSAFASHGISVSAYTTEASPNEVLDWYRSEMSSRGWTKILDNAFDNCHIISFQKENERASVIENRGTLILVHGMSEQFQAIAEEWYQENQAPSYPALSAAPAASDSTIRIYVQMGSLPASEWEYSVGQTEGSYGWVTGTEELSSPYVDLGAFTQGVYYVSLRHIPTGHIYFADVEVTIL
jgi:hypothetical protein